MLFTKKNLFKYKDTYRFKVNGGGGGYPMLTLIKRKQEYKF